MICPKCGCENIEGTGVCSFCGELLLKDKQAESFVWSELPPMPVFPVSSGEKQDEEETGKGGTFRRRIRRYIRKTGIFVLEACILAGVVYAVVAWKGHQYQPPPPSADNIVYSSDDIVMMLVKQREQWILDKPEEGYNACCFLDLDFDGSPELISISYDKESQITLLEAYRVRSCKLEKISVDQWEEEKPAEFFDISQQITLYYAPDTKEMLYFSGDTAILSDTESKHYVGSFYMQENRVFRKNYFCRELKDGSYSYYSYDEERTAAIMSGQEYRRQQNELVGRFVNLHLYCEWVTSKDDLKELSNHKLAALLLRSYDSFSYDTSGLALQ
ncbi:MAG: hypothetical protein IJ496_01110 [Ruminococcus sp.]|nr:hypothetical protein [Ruminococcus sp.]